MIETNNLISTTAQIASLKKEINKHKDNQRKMITQKYDEKKKNHKNNLMLDNILSLLFVIYGLCGGDKNSEKVINGKNGVDKVFIILGLLGFLANIFYFKDIEKLNMSMQKELDEIV